MDLDSKVDYGEDNENMEEDLPPLFMQVTLTIKEGRKFVKSFSIKSLPTCLFDLAQDAATSSCYDDRDEGISSIDLADLNITLDLVCMMQSEVVPLKGDTLGGGCQGGGPQGTRHISLTSNISDQNKTSISSYSSLVDGLICEDKLPEVQSEVVTALVKEIKWILADEIAFAMIRSPGGIEAVTLKVWL